MIIFILAIFAFISLAFTQIPQNFINNTVIGILSQPSGFNNFPGADYSYIFSSYVQHVEASGARVVPIKYTSSKKQIRDLLDQVNGVLIPGGGADLIKKNEKDIKQLSRFSKTAKNILEIAQEKNDKGIYFPVWGTCLGFELMAIAQTGNLSMLSKLDGLNRLGNLIFNQNEFQHSKIFQQNLSSDLIDVVQNRNLLHYNHKYGITVETFRNHQQLNEDWRIIATAIDLKGQEFVAIAESKKYPFYGVQFHPEKNAHDWSKGSNVDHSQEGIKINQHLSLFFTLEARKNNQTMQQKRKFIKYYNQVYLQDYDMGVYLFNSKGKDQYKIQKDDSQQASFIQNNNELTVLNQEQTELIKNLLVQQSQKKNDHPNTFSKNSEDDDENEENDQNSNNNNNQLSRKLKNGDDDQDEKDKDVEQTIEEKNQKSQIKDDKKSEKQLSNSNKTDEKQSKKDKIMYKLKSKIPKKSKYKNKKPSRRHRNRSNHSSKKKSNKDKTIKTNIKLQEEQQTFQQKIQAQQINDDKLIINNNTIDKNKNYNKIEENKQQQNQQQQQQVTLTQVQVQVNNSSENNNTNQTNQTQEVNISKSIGHNKNIGILYNVSHFLEQYYFIYLIIAGSAVFLVYKIALKKKKNFKLPISEKDI